MTQDVETKRLSKAGYLILAAILAGVSWHPSSAQESETPAPLLLIFDASGSMWGQIQGENKIVIARRVVGDLADDLPDDQELALIAYGHRREGDCDDIETVLPMGPLHRETLTSTVNALNPKGKTPITKSVKQAFAALEQLDTAATIILVSDGLETCGGDPCSAVRLAKDRGLDFVLHVVGFDVAGEDTSSLQCSAQAGGGMFLGAENAAELRDALERAVAMSADVPAGRLAVKGVRNGELHDVGIVVTDSAGELIGNARTYASEDTNPSSIPLPDGVFDVEVRAIGIKGASRREFQIEIEDSSVVERTEDFSTGEISIGVTRNGELSDAVYKVELAGAGEPIASGRTYTSERQNPALVTLTAGVYDVSVGSVEINGRPWVELGRVVVEPGQRAELSHAFSSGTLTVKVHRGDALVDGLVNVYKTDGAEVARARSYKSEASNPVSFVLEPGSYRVEVKEIRGSETKFAVTVEAEDTLARAVDLDQP